MRKFKVSFRRLAEADLLSLYEYIAERDGLDRASQYIERIEAACRALESFPMRGMRRDDLRTGLRTLGFAGRVTIAFEVKRTEVQIVRIFYGGRDYERALKVKTRE